MAFEGEDSRNEQPWSKFVGKWVEDRNENLDQYLAEAGANFLLRKLAGWLRPVITVTVEGSLLTFSAVITLFKAPPSVFDVNGPETVSEAMGMQTRTKTIWQDDKLVQEVTVQGLKPQHVEMDIVDNVLVQNMRIGEVTAARYFKRVED